MSSQTWARWQIVLMQISFTQWRALQIIKQKYYFFIHFLLVFICLPYSHFYVVTPLILSYIAGRSAIFLGVELEGETPVAIGDNITSIDINNGLRNVLAHDVVGYNCLLKGKLSLNKVSKIMYCNRIVNTWSGLL